MLKYFLFTIYLVLSVSIIVSASSLNRVDNDLGDLINQISAKVASFQVLKPVNYSPPFRWAEKLGLYKSNIRINVFGDPVLQAVRNGDLTTVFDNDMFSTGWIITCLMEAQLYGKGAPSLDVSRLQLALEAIGQYNNKNDPNSAKSLLRTFWPQTYNKTLNIWQQQPINIRNVVLNVEKIPWNDIEKFFSALHLEKFVELCKELQQSGETILSAFSIPPDFDDTYLNLGLGATLYKLRDQYANAYQSWLQNNTDVSHLMYVTSKYAYRPFESDVSQNTIDPRTFFYAREFIQSAQTSNQPLSLITTWIQNIDEQRHLRDESISMPFNLNNVDVTVASNSIYGIASGSIYNINGFGDLFLTQPDMQQIFLNSTKFISWAIQANLSSRPDLAQVYYPSTYNFMWYASRTLFLIENEYQNYMNLLNSNNKEHVAFVKRFRALKPILEEALSYLQPAFEIFATVDLFKWTRIDEKDKTKTYFCDFLGLNDTTLFGKHVETNDDCIFSTSQAINILINTWTVQDPTTKQLRFKGSIAPSLKHLLQSSAAWLQENVLSNKYKKLNAFFSGSVKGFTSLPFWYPQNFIQYLNGTFVPESQIPESDLDLVIAGVSGSIDEKTYQDLLKQKHFGVQTPIDFAGYNTKGNFFPFWSSEPYTYAVSLLALSQYNNLAF